MMFPSSSSFLGSSFAGKIGARSKLFLAVAAAFGTVGIASAATYTPEKITGGESWAQPGIQERSGSTVIYTFEEGDIVKPTKKTTGGVYLNDGNPNTAGITDVVLKNLSLDLTDTGRNLYGLVVHSANQALRLENGRVDVHGDRLAQGLLMWAGSSKADLDNVVFDVTATSVGNGLIVDTSATNTRISGTSVSGNVTSNVNAHGVFIESAGNTVTADKLSFNVTVNEGGGQYNEAWVTGMSVVAKSKVTSKETELVSSSHSLAGRNNWVEGVRAFNQADLDLGKTDITVKADLDSGTNSRILGVRAWKADVTMGDANISVNGQFKHQSRTNAQHSNVAHGLYAEGNGTIVGGNGNIDVVMSGPTRKGDAVRATGIEVLDGSTGNTVRWGNGRISARADLNAAGGGNVYGVSALGDATTSVTLGNVDLTASATGTKTDEAPGSGSYIAALRTLKGQLTMGDGDLTADFTGYVGQNGRVDVSGVENTAAAIQMGNGNVTASLAGTVDHAKTVLVHGVTHQQGTLLHGDGDILAKSQAEQKNAQQFNVFGIRANSDLSWGDGSITAESVGHTDTSNLMVAGLYRHTNATGEVNLGKTDIKALLHVNAAEQSTQKMGQLVVAGIHSNGGVVNKQDGNITATADGEVGIGDYFSVNGVLVQNGRATLANGNVTVQANLAANHSSQTDIRGLSTRGKAEIDMGDGQINTDVTFNANGYTTVSSVLGSAEEGNEIRLGNVAINTTAHAFNGSEAQSKAMELNGILMKNGLFSMQSGSIVSRVDGETERGAAYGVQGQGQSKLTIGSGNGRVDISTSTTSTKYGEAIGILGIEQSSIAYNGGRIVSSEIGVKLDGSARLEILGDTDITGKKFGMIVNGEGTLDVLSGKSTVNSLRNQGTVNVKGGSLTVGHVIETINGKWAVADGGSLTFLGKEGSLSKINTLAVDRHASLSFIGTEGGNGAFEVSGLVNNGTVNLSHATLHTGADLQSTDDSTWVVGNGGVLNFNAKNDQAAVGASNAEVFALSAPDDQMTVGSIRTERGAVVNFEGNAKLNGATGDGHLQIAKLATLEVAGNAVMAEGENQGTVKVTNGAKLTTGADFDASNGQYIAENGELTFEDQTKGLTLGSLTASDTGVINIVGQGQSATTVTVRDLSNEGTVNLSNAKLSALSDGAGFAAEQGNWNLTKSEVSFRADGDTLAIGKVTGDADSKLSIQNDEGKTITVESLAGNGLTVGIANVQGPAVNVGVNLAQNVKIVADAGNGTDFTSEQAFAEAIAKTVTTGTGDNKQSVATEVQAAEGDIYNGFTAKVDGNGSVVLDEVTENKKLAAYRSVQGLSNFMWRHDMNDLTKRMGELRDSPEGTGVWARLYGSEQEYGSALTARNNSVQVGGDIDVGSGWKVGSAFSYTDGDSRYSNGSADSESWGFGVYGSWFADDGRFVDLIAKYARIKNDFELDAMAADVSNNALSLSAEIGWNLAVSNGLFIEPQLEMTWGRVDGRTFSTSNGVTVAQKDFDSFIVRGGVRGGWTLPDNLGRVYARASLVHDFEGEAESVATKNLGRVEFKDDLGGTWVEYGLGANLNINQSTYTYVDLERTSGGEVKENWRWNVGIRHAF